MGDADTALRHLGRPRWSGAASARTSRCCSRARARRRCAARSCATASASRAAGRRPARRASPFPNPAQAAPPDPFALVELSRDVRPPDYATAFVRQANELSGLERPISVCCAERPDWLAAVAKEPGALETSLPVALRLYRQ